MTAYESEMLDCGQVIKELTILREKHLFFFLFIKFLKPRSDLYLRERTTGNRVRTLGGRGQWRGDE